MKQWLRRFDEEKRRAIGEEIQKLLAAIFVKEVFHPEWLANPVLVKNKNGKWRMCVDYTNLNKACPKDPFPLPRIDQIVDSTSGYKVLSFLDAYSNYHQIMMKESNQPVPLSSPRLGLTAMSPCRSSSRMRGIHTSSVCSPFLGPHRANR
jgi:hypothetical protein